tara:strand:+ start:703 stop:2427 length:1725 start_codon:yes stop_codon:yes gene_type:complete
MRGRALLLTLLFCASMLSGCFGDEDVGPPSAADLDVGASTLVGGVFQYVDLRADVDLAVYVPYLLQSPESGFIQNSTVVDINGGDSVELLLLAPPRIDSMFFLIGEQGREHWPVRAANESWATWVGRGAALSPDGGGIERVVMENTTVDAVNNSGKDGGRVAWTTLNVVRPMAAAFGEDEGGQHATGLIHGRTVYDRLHAITDPAYDLTDIDRRAGYWDRWAGQGNAAYEDAAQYLIRELESFGLEVMTHRFEFTDIFNKQNPEAYNICGYRWGEVTPDEWLVFGAHFDVAPPANSALPFVDPHITGSRTYGTRVGAYDNTAGTSMVLETAKAMSEFKSRRTMVFCLWSGEEGGKRGSDYWTEYWVADDNPHVTVTNYVNLDMAGVNWPGGGGAPHGDPDPEPSESGYPKDTEVWPMRVYIGPTASHENNSQQGMVSLSEWIGADALGLEEQIGSLVGAGFEESTWKYDSWIEGGRKEIIIYEDTTARSDHASFQDNLGTVTLGFGGLVDGYWCYHQTCDTLAEMEAWMDTTGKDYGEENTGVSNLVNSLDLITWWAVFSFFHLDEQPILNQLE